MEASGTFTLRDTQPAAGATKFHRILLTPDLVLSPNALDVVEALSHRPLLRPTALADVVDGRHTRDVDAILTSWKSVLDASVLGRYPNVRYIGVRATSLEKIDLDFTRGHGIAVSNIQAYGDIGTTEFIVESMLDHVRERRLTDGHVPMELAGKRLGLIGFGNVARLLAPIARAMGMHVHFYVPHPRRKKRPASASYRSLPWILRNCDFISVQTPAFKPVLTLGDLRRIPDRSVLIVTTLGLPFSLDDFRTWREHSKVRVVLDLVAAHGDAEILRPHAGVDVRDLFSARTLESIARAEQQVIDGMRRFLSSAGQ